MYSLGVGRTFTARHYLVGGDWGAENNEHSHRYGLEVVLEADALDHHGFLVDIVEVERYLDELVALFKDQTLNDLEPFAGVNPSIERFAGVIHRLLRKRLQEPRLTGMTVIIREDDIAWTSCREAL